MKRLALALALGALVCLPCLLFVSCGSDGDPGPGPTGCEGLRADAYTALENKLYQHVQDNAVDPEAPDDIDFSAALAAYEDAYDCDTTNLEAAFGLAVCNLLILTTDPEVNAAFDEWEAYLDANTPFQRPNKSAGRSLVSLLGLPSGPDAMNLPFAMIQDNILAQTALKAAGEPQVAEVQRILHDVVLPKVEDAITALGPVVADAGFTYRVSGTMQGDGDEDVAWIDHTDVLVLRAGCRLLAAGLRIATAYDLQFTDYDDAGMLAGLDQTTGNIMSLRTGGLERMQATPSYILGAVDDVQDAITSLLAETDDQDDDVIKIGPQDIDRDDVEEWRDDHLPDIEEAFSAEGIDYNEDWNNDNVKTDLRIVVSAFFDSPIEDWKKELPPYALTIDTRSDEYGDENYFVDTISMLNIDVPASNYGSARDYYVYVRDYEIESTEGYNTYNFQAFKDECESYVADAIDELESRPEADWTGNCDFHFHNEPVGSSGVQDLLVNVSGYFYTSDEFYYVPVVTWAADTFEQWRDAMPTPDLNGLLPDINTGQEFCETFGLDDRDWDKVMIINWVDGSDYPVGPVGPGGK